MKKIVTVILSLVIAQKEPPKSENLSLLSQKRLWTIWRRFPNTEIIFKQ